MKDDKNVSLSDEEKRFVAEASTFFMDEKTDLEIVDHISTLIHNESFSSAMWSELFIAAALAGNEKAAQKILPMIDLGYVRENDPFKWTPLHAAIVGGLSMSMLLNLVSNKNVNHINAEGKNAFHLIFEVGKSGEQKDVICSHLIFRLICADVDLHAKNTGGESPLETARKFKTVGLLFNALTDQSELHYYLRRQNFLGIADTAARKIVDVIHSYLIMFSEEIGYEDPCAYFTRLFEAMKRRLPSLEEIFVLDNAKINRGRQELLAANEEPNEPEGLSSSPMVRR